MIEPERDALLLEILGRPDDPEPYHVLADWLSEAGDPLGTWMARGLTYPGPVTTVDLRPEDRDWLAVHTREVLGRFGWWLDGQYDARGRALRWKWGLLDAIEIHGHFRPLEPIVRAALEAPAAIALRALTVCVPPGGEPSLLAPLGRAPVRSL
ncbi:MAG: hypothetical protein AAF602_33090, partial [Myxococcota bacterium]